MDYPLTKAALVEYQRVLASKPKPENNDIWATKNYNLVFGTARYNLRRTFWQERAGKYTLDECLELTVEQIEGLI